MKTKDLLNSDKAWQLKPDDILQNGDWIEAERGRCYQLRPAVASGLEKGERTARSFGRTGFLYLFVKRAFRTGMVK